MKKMLLATVVTVVLFFICGQAQAEQTFSLENGNLVVKEVKVVKIVPGVPKGISAEAAYNLIGGKSKEETVWDKKGKRSYSFSYPLKNRAVFSDQLITYSQGRWAERTSSRIKEESDWALTIICLWIPAIGILIVSIANALLKVGARKLLVFYASMLAGGLVGGSVGVFAGGLVGGLVVGGLVGTLTGSLAGWLVGGLVGVFADGFADGFADAFAGGLVGGFVGGLAGIGMNYEIVIYYLVFLLGIEIASFTVSRIAGIVKKRIPAIKKWVEAG